MTGDIGDGYPVADSIHYRSFFMNPFAIFVILYATSFLMEMLEKWKYPGFSLAALVIVIFLVFTRITKFKFLIFLVLTTAYFSLLRFPDVANHVNLLIYLNVALIVGGIYSYFVASRRDSLSRGNEYYEMMLPLLRSALMLVYFLAGFHKLNRDFFNPEFSCARIFFLRILSAAKTKFLDLPIFFWLTIIFLILVWYLLLKKLSIWSKNKYLPFGFLVAIVPVSWGILVLFKVNANFLLSLIPLIGLLTAIIVVAWEILGGLLLSIAKLQLPILVFSLMMHLILAPIGFVDFGSLALALLFTFIPLNYYQLLINNIYFDILSFKFNLVHLYFLLNTLGGLIAGISYLIYPLPNIAIITGLLFDVSALIFIYPLVSAIFLPVAQRPIWQGLSLFNNKMPKFMAIFPLFLLLFGFSSYLGLGTAGNFSMFSNLRTEGTSSNHFLLSNNPLKIFNYQEDAVEIYVAIDERHRNIMLNNFPLQSHFLPLVEFKKLIYDLTQSNQKVAMRFEYQNKVYQSRDIINDPTWKTTQKNWEMKLLNFRLISPSEFNECRW